MPLDIIQRIEVPNTFKEIFIFHFNSDMNVADLQCIISIISNLQQVLLFN